MSRGRSRLFSPRERCCGRLMGGFDCRRNKNGNRNRSYRDCERCGRLCADDWEGWRPNNPPCECGFPSRIQHQQKGKHFTYRCLYERRRRGRKCRVRERI
ncbi:hypothetical protein BDV27DRAFT_126662 [Aspergillus caelatus]|uniref:Uncharacterized protein n=2 Tax=Aspergillus subgen. Circumdati TaxID=2720871 RepID=A0A5N7A6Y5_9EURO|nr:uncharacterized protein BDV27DRAFT_126662 [Aspergillus caelatus]KAE8365604.1 hypothetical protein BDV27DRAFT_126662 [Aspergillus caelatus]KAE8421663.1 hypothetical protein BDV36DRAFT_247248 [Aspergillus pseudocaelatus]